MKAKQSKTKQSEAKWFKVTVLRRCVRRIVSTYLASTDFTFLQKEQALCLLSAYDHHALLQAFIAIPSPLPSPALPFPCA